MCSTCARRASACEQVVRAASECEQHRRGGNATELSTPVVQLHFHDIAVRSSRHRVSVTRTSLLNPHQRLRTVWRPAPRPVPHHPKIGRSSGVDLSAQTANCRRRRLKDKRTLPHRQSGRDSSSAPMNLYGAEQNRTATPEHGGPRAAAARRGDPRRRCAAAFRRRPSSCGLRRRDARAAVPRAAERV